MGGSGDAGTGSSSSTTSDYNQCIVNADTLLVHCQYRGNLVCSAIGGLIGGKMGGPAGGAAGGVAYGACYAAYDQMCRATHDSGNVASCQRTKQCLDAGRPLSECGSAWFRISHGGDFADPWPNTETEDYDHGVCKAKPSLPQCEP